MGSDFFSKLLEKELPPEPFVRAALALLETQFRALALVALQDWAACDIPRDEMFMAVASLQRPSWGSWNGLFAALRAARRGIMRTGDPDQRQRVEGAKTLDRILALLDGAISAELAAQLKPLSDVTRSPISAKSKVGAVLALPISLRNRVAHDTPGDQKWWAQAAAALQPLVQFQGQNAEIQAVLREAGYPAPWFLEADAQVLSFNGMEHDFAVLYVGETGVSRAAPERTQEMLLLLARLLGRADVQEKEFKRLLSRLAPEEIRGVMLGDYLVGKPVGEGGFATVHVGRQLSTGRKVAIKILHDGMEADTIARFQQEATFLSRFRHPNIVDVYGFGQETWSAPRAFSLADEPWFAAFSRSAPVKTFIALEWIEGRTLDEVYRESLRVPETRPSLQTCVHWLAAAAKALSVVHAAGLIHRDIKPHNLMITNGSAAAEGQIKLMDFGIARVVKAERTLVTETGHALGTPAYMSPEQIRNDGTDGAVGPASDVYSLSATFYELITGQRLYQHDTITMDEVKTLKITGRRPTRPRTVIKGLPWEIETILLGGLEPEPADRYRTMDSFERDIRHFLLDEPIEHKQPSLWRRGRLVYRRNRAISNLAALFFIVAIVGVAAYVRSIRAAERRTAQQRDIAVRNEVLAISAKALADAREKDIRLRLAELSSNNGHTLLNKGDPTGALLWYTRSLPLLSDAPELEKLERRRIGITLRQMPHPISWWNYDVPEGHATFAITMSQDGKRLASSEIWKPRGSPKGTLRGVLRLLNTLTGHPIAPAVELDQPITSLSFSTDGSRLAGIVQDEIRVYDTATAKPIGVPIVDPAGSRLAQLNGPGSRVLSISSDQKLLTLFDVASGTATVPPYRSERALEYAQFSPKGDRVLIAGLKGAAHSDATFRMIDVLTGQAGDGSAEVTTYWSAAFSPDGSSFAACSGDGWARIYSCDTMQQISGPLLHSGPVLGVSFSPDGKRVATVSSDKTARVWDAATGKALLTPLVCEETPYEVGFSSDGRRVGAVSYDKSLRVWDMASGFPLAPSIKATSPLEFAAFVPGSPDQFMLLTQDGVERWDYSRAAQPGAAIYDNTQETTTAVFSADSRHMVLNGSKGPARIVDPVQMKIQGQAASTGPQLAVDLTPDGTRLASASADGARIWTVGNAAPELKLFIPRPSGVAIIKISADGRRLLTVDRDAPRTQPSATMPSTVALSAALLWNAESGAPVGIAMTHTDAITDAILSIDGRLVATASADGTSRVWDAFTGQPVTPLLVSGHHVTSATFSADGRLLGSPDYSGTANIWDISTQKSKATVAYSGGATQVSFSPDASQFLVAGYANEVSVFDLAHGERPYAVLSCGSATPNGAFSPDGMMIYTGSILGGRLWSATGKPMGPVLISNGFRPGTFSPDGKWLVTMDSRVRQFDISPDERSAHDLEELAKLLSGRILDDRGVMTNIPPTDLLKLFVSLRTKYPGEFAARPDPATQSDLATQPEPAVH